MKTAVINPQVKDKVAHLIVATSPDYLKNARSIAKAVAMDAKFNKWLDSDASKLGIKIFDDSEFREKVLDSIKEFTSIEEKQATVIAMLSASVDDIVKAKDAEVTKNLVLSESQKEAHVQQLTKFATAVNRTAKRALIEMGITLGVVSYEEVKEAEPAQIAG